MRLHQASAGSSFLFALAAVFSSSLLLTSPAPGAVVFSDNFSTSTLAIGTPYPATTSTSTGYVIASTRPQSPAPSISTGHLDFGMGAASSAIEQTQALFTTTPVHLSATGDEIEYTITFVPTNINNPTTSSTSAEMEFGLFYSGGSAPDVNMSNAALINSSSTDATGGAQNWQGYSIRLFSQVTSASSSKMDTRPPQTGTDNRNQELLTAGASSSSSYQNPVSIGSTSSGTNISPTNGQPYTDDLLIQLTAPGVEKITNNIYSGTTVTGTPVSTFTKSTNPTASPSTYQTATFDALAFGWRETTATGVTSVASSVDINSITVSAIVAPPTILLGDMNFDGHVDAKDMVAMESALANPSGYLTTDFGNGTPTSHGATLSNLGTYADVSGGGKFDNADLQALLLYLKNGHGNLSQVPEPASIVLAGLGFALLGCSWRRRKAA